MTHTYNITGMTCNGCVAKVKSELLKLGEVTNADVQLHPQQATISMQSHISLPKLQDAVHKAGNYTISATTIDMPNEMVEEATTAKSYYPIFLIFAYIAGVSGISMLNHGEWHWMVWMPRFMAGFFLVFSFFKLLNLKAFAEAYGTYDIVAKKMPAYGYIYPFIELALGIAFMVGFNPGFTNAVTLLVMGVSIIGVIQSLLKKTTFQCACLGTIIQLPLSKVTLFEDALMIVMSIFMLLADRL